MFYIYALIQMKEITQNTNTEHSKELKQGQNEQEAQISLRTLGFALATITWFLFLHRKTICQSTSAHQNKNVEFCLHRRGYMRVQHFTLTGVK